MVSEVVEYGEDRVVFDTFSRYSDTGPGIESVSKELSHLAAILHVYAGGLNFMK